MSEVLSGISVEILKTLGSTAVKELGVWWNYKDELEKLEDTVATVQAVLLDAEEEHQASHQFKHWLGKLRNVLHDAEELVDDFSTELLRRQVMSGNNITKEVRVFFSWSSNQFIYGRRMGYKIKVVREALDSIAKDRTNFHFTVSSIKPSTIYGEGRDNVALFNHDENVISKLKGEIFGRDDEKREIIENHLLKPDGDMVISIVGSGGLGKTTLARLIFDDDKVKSHFDVRMWVSVGDVNFNVDEIVDKAIKSTIKKESGHNIGEKEAEGEGNRNLGKLKSVKNEVKRESGVNIGEKEAEGEGNRKRTFAELIHNKKNLLVLDDVWSEDRNKWIDLENMWSKDCASGSKVLLTTRSSFVAKMIGNKEPYLLGYLSLSHSIPLFKKIVFGEQKALKEGVEDNLEKIVKKCGGVPLAIKTIGNLLYFLNPETEWLPYVTNEISKYPKANNNIFPTLQLSYNHLPSPLKYCFAYCKIFPKGYEIDEETLIQLWIAQGYIKASNMSDQSLEDIGMQYCKVLLARSFFQDEGVDDITGNKTLKMHDIMHELTSYIGSGDIVYSDPLGNDVKKNTHHLSYEWLLSPHLDSFLEARKLRTFLSLYNKETDYPRTYRIETRRCNKMLKKLKSLLVLDLQAQLKDEDEKWSLKAALTRCIRWTIQDQGLKSIGKLKHLRYLDLSYNNIKELPKSITKLQNLRVLKIFCCHRLRKLPENLKKLVNLQILDCHGCYRIRYMPRGLGNLTSLHTITNFVVAKGPKRKSEAGLDELKNLSFLKVLKLRNLGDGKKDLAEFDGVNLKEKRHLRILALFWSGDSVDDVDYSKNALLKLEPPLTLQDLTIDSYGGIEFPHWFLHLTNLVILNIKGCKKCEHLPPLPRLPCLKTLEICSCNKLRYVEDDRSDGAIIYPSLKILVINRCSKLERWWKTEHNADAETTTTTTTKTTQYPCLSRLRVWFCPKLTSMPLFPSLDDRFWLLGSPLKPLQQTWKMVLSVSTTSSSSSLVHPLSRLKRLNIWYEDFEDVGWIPEAMQQLSSLQSLELRCPGLKEKCGNKMGTDWHKISHIPNITVYQIEVQKEGRYQLDEKNDDER